MPKYNSSFQDDWLNEEEFKSWISKDKSCYYAFCKVCCKSFDISSMGKSALTSHMKGKKHKDRLHLCLPLPLTTYEGLHTQNQSSSSSYVQFVSSPNSAAVASGISTPSQSKLNEVSSSNLATTYGASSLVQLSDIKKECDPYIADGTANVSCNSDYDVSSNSERLEERDGYLDTSYNQWPHPASKKRKMAFTPSSANSFDAVSKLDKSSYHRETEFDIWTKSVAKQLNNMDLGRALRLQLKIQSLLTEERLEHDC